VESHSSNSFEDLKQHVAKMPGTARAVVVVSCSRGPGVRAPYEDFAVDGNTLKSVAVFRAHYADPGALVGRTAGPGRGQLSAVVAGQMMAAVLLDPRISRELLRFKELPQPQLRQEYLQLGAWVVPSEVGDLRELPSPEEGKTGHVAAKPWRSVMAETVNFAPAPTATWMATLWQAMEHPDACGGDLLALLRLVRAWLDGSEGPKVRFSAQAALDARGFPHGGLVACIQRVGSRKRHGGADLEICLEATSIIRLILQESMARIHWLAQVGIVRAICELMQKWPESLQIQVASVTILSELLKDRTAAMEALDLDVAILINIATNTYPDSDELRAKSTLAVQRMVMHR